MDEREKIKFLLQMLDSRESYYLAQDSSEAPPHAMVVSVSTFLGSDREKIKKELFKLLEL